MLRHLVHLFVITLLAFVSSACNSFPVALTAEEAARKLSAQTSPDSVSGFRMMGTRAWGRVTVVLYTELRLAEELGPPTGGLRPPMQLLGYSLVEQTPLGTWRALESGTSEVSPLPSEDLVDFRSGHSRSNAMEFSIVYGRALSSDVMTVEATFDTGQVVRDAASDGLFVLIVPVDAAPCELRALNADSQVMRRIDLTLESGAEHRCSGR